MVESREVHLVNRPKGLPRAEDFAIVATELGEPGPGEMLVRNIWMSVDPYMRGRMRAGKSYVAPFEVGQVLEGGAVGEVVSSNIDGYEPGDMVLSMAGWREFFLSDGEGIRKLPPTGAPSELYLGLLGMPGMTAYFGLYEVGQLKDGETVFVSGAAGAVGSVVCQLAKIRGCTVIGSCGSDEKAKWIEQEMGADAVINYRNCDDLTKALAEAAPDGIDVYFDNVGGEHLEAALMNMRNRGRIVECGMIADYNATGQLEGTKNLIQIIVRQLRIEGFIVGTYESQFPDAMKVMMNWYHEGQLNARSTVLEGIEKAPEALIGLFEGVNTGKMLVNLCSHEHMGIEVEFI